MYECLEYCGHNCETCNYKMSCEYYGDTYEMAETGTAEYNPKDNHIIKTIDTQAQSRQNKRNFETPNG